jgi:hypothetical protein
VILLQLSDHAGSELLHCEINRLARQLFRKGSQCQKLAELGSHFGVLLAERPMEAARYDRLEFVLICRIIRDLLSITRALRSIKRSCAQWRDAA